jgi:translation initiation factor IF-3
VIAPDGAQLGVLTVEEALAAAQERGLDLVEVAPLARPPVAKIMDYGKVKVTMMYRGRQMAHIDLGRAVLDRVANELKDIAKIEQDPKLEGRNMSMVLAPK